MLGADTPADLLNDFARKGIDADEIDTVFLTHLHGDHFGGLPFLLMDAHYRARRTEPLTLAGPPGMAERLKRLQESLYPGSSTRVLNFDVEFRVLKARRLSRMNGLLVTPFEVVHPSGAPSYALRIEYAGRTLTFSGDTEWTEELCTAAAGADLFVCECNSYSRRIPNHLSYREVQAQKHKIDCRRIILTHLGADMIDRPGLDLECAAEGAVYTV